MANADREISMLPALDAVTDETLVPVYQPGAQNPAQSMTGAQFKEFAKIAVENEVQLARDAANSASNSAGLASESAYESRENAASAEAAAERAESAAARAEQAGTQPDWNQNDSEAPDYIRNRPFYDGGSDDSLLVVTMVEIEPDMETGSFHAEVSFVEGDSYTVRWNGTKYECVAQYGNGFWGEAEFQTVDLKAPGVFEIYDYGGGEFWVQSFAGHGTVEIIISLAADGVKKIDPKYLPTETWVFTLEDGSTIEKKVVVAE